MNVHDLLPLLADDLTQIAASVAAVLAIVGTLRTIRTRRDLTATRAQGVATHAKLEDVEHRWNGRLDEILAITRDAAYQRGLADGLRQTLAECPVRDPRRTPPLDRGPGQAPEETP